MSEQDHILVVEDEPITREQLVSYFEEEGFRVSSTGNGDEVQKIIDENDVILVLLDIKLPGKDGLTLTRRHQPCTRQTWASEQRFNKLPSYSGRVTDWSR